MHFAFEFAGGSFDSFFFFLKNNYNDEDYNSADETALTLAITYNQPLMFVHLLHHSPEKINQYDFWGSTLLLFAIQKRQIEIIKHLLAHPFVDVNQPDKQGTLTPLISSIQRGYTEITRLLLEHPAINIEQPVNNYKKAINFAFEYKKKYPNAQCVQLLMDHMVQESRKNRVRAMPTINAGFFGQFSTINPQFAVQPSHHLSLQEVKKDFIISCN
ncbi:MAG: ankyrin repeat domain-containing protein [Legionellales bacterium]|nr:ankyrin repeat domain-containing protein [Legionellales bacterium]